MLTITIIVYPAADIQTIVETCTIPYKILMPFNWIFIVVQFAKYIIICTLIATRHICISPFQLMELFQLLQQLRLMFCLFLMILNRLCIARNFILEILV